LSSAAQRAHRDSAALLGANEKPGRSSLSRSSDSGDSDYTDSWSDTGDLGEQLADLDDPLEIRLRDSLDRQVFGGSSRRHTRSKRVRYQDDTYSHEPKQTQAGIVKEDIRIPVVRRQRTISKAEHILAAIMSGGERQMHGLTGKALVYGNNPSVMRTT
jgi:hypothetical protein